MAWQGKQDRDGTTEGQVQTRGQTVPVFTSYPESPGMCQHEALMSGDDEQWSGISVPGLQNSRWDHAASIQDGAEALTKDQEESSAPEPVGQAQNMEQRQAGS